MVSFVLMLDLSCQLSSVKRNITQFSTGGGCLMMYGERRLWICRRRKRSCGADLNARQFAAELVGDAVDPNGSATRLPPRIHEATYCRAINHGLSTALDAALMVIGGILNLLLHPSGFDG